MDCRQCRYGNIRDKYICERCGAALAYVANAEVCYRLEEIFS